ncbi:MAG: E3 ubiquitin ligase family protein [Deltaproteobacteria bacterium]|nr:E3 ubiquitin ligase family protein [Deltaproteobacteria bacterium]
MLLKLVIAFVLGCIVVIALTILIFYFIYVYFLVRGLQVTQIFNLSSGIRQIEGQVVRFADLVESPVFKLPAVFYVSRVFKLGKRKRKIFCETSDTPFYLDDGTGKILVIPHGAEFVSDPDLSRVDNFINLKHFSRIWEKLFFLQRLLGFGYVRLEEQIICEGNTVCVIGYVKFKDSKYFSASSNFIIYKHPFFPFLISKNSEAQILSAFQGRILMALFLLFLFLSFAVINLALLISDFY